MSLPVRQLKGGMVLILVLIFQRVLHLSLFAVSGTDHPVYELKLCTINLDQGLIHVHIPVHSFTGIHSQFQNAQKATGPLFSPKLKTQKPCEL